MVPADLVNASHGSPISHYCVIVLTATVPLGIHRLPPTPPPPSLSPTMSYPYPVFINDEDPPTIEDAENEGGNLNAFARGSASGHLSQAQLRQQAHLSAGLGNSAGSPTGRANIAAAASAGDRGVYPGLHNLSLSDTIQRPSFCSIHVPEYGEMESPASADTSGWSVVETNGGTPPSARSLHAAAVLNGVLYVWGGYNGDRLNTFHAFSFAEKRWSPVLPSTSLSHGPSPRDRHVAFAFGNSFYVHGGFDGTSRVSDFWGFDFSSMQWREVEILGGRPPSPRHSHAAVVYGQSLFIFGGYDGSYKYVFL